MHYRSGNCRSLILIFVLLLLVAYLLSCDGKMTTGGSGCAGGNESGIMQHLE